jgi:hypothetical protein
MMTRLLKVTCVVVASIMTLNGYAGNPDRAGEAGASELLINPWAMSAGWYGLNVASVRGIESMNLNVAGLTFINQTQLEFSRSEYLVGSDIGISSFGFAQKVGEGAIGLSLTSFNLGDVPVTTTQNPEGTGAFYTPRLSNIAVSYSRKFADYLSGGFTLRGVSENIADARAFGISMDVGIQYITGPVEHPDQIKFGVALRNIGSPMRFQGDGVTFSGEVPEGDYSTTISFRTENFELPSLLTIGLSYDFYFGTKHRLTAVGNFISNSFYKDQFGVGAEYGLKVKGQEMFMLRAGYRYEDGITSNDPTERTTAHTGLAAGATFQTRFTEDSNTMISINYAYRASDPFDGTHSLGVRLSL